MARPDWGAKQQEFLADHAKTNVSPKEWCEAQGLNYSTAKRHIKIANAQKTAKGKTANSQIDKVEKSVEELMDEEGINHQQATFVVEYLKDKNGTQAAVRAGYSEKTANEQAARLLANVSVADAINKQLKALAIRTLINADEIVANMWQVATLDMREISELRRGCCRHCWGENFGYQWTEEEYEKACERAEARDKPAPSLRGGLGYVRTLSPNDDCPACGGEGVAREFFHDSRKLSPVAAMAFNGVKRTKDGIEIMTLDRAAMYDRVMKHIGMLDSPAAKRIQQLEAEKRELENARLRDESNKPERPENVEEDYQLQALTPDENIPGKPIL